VIVLDANLLLYSYDTLSPHHSAARPWLERTLSGQEIVGLPWQSLWAFLRISTNSRIFLRSMAMSESIAVANGWLACRNVRLLTPGEHHWSLLKTMLLDGQVSGSMTTDAQLAAITMEHGGVLHTTDRDFARFPGLRWVNPLAVK